MKLDHLDPADLRRMGDALLGGEPVMLDLHRPPPPRVRLDDIVPLCHEVRAWEPRETAALSLFLPPGARPGCRARVSVVIPTCRRTPLGLCAFRGQDVVTEVLVLANGSARAHPSTSGQVQVEGDRVVEVPWEGHGTTRQRGVELAKEDYVFFTVDDAIPMGAGFLRSLVTALEEGGFDAVFARQVPWPTADGVTRRRLRDWTPPGLAVRRVERLDHVGALVRRETLLRNPLPDVPIAEDLHWARGRAIGYVPFAPLLHSHPRTVRTLFERTRAIHREYIALGEIPRVPSFFSLLGALPSTWTPILQNGPASVAHAGAELAGQWMAARDHHGRPN